MPVEEDESESAPEKAHRRRGEPLRSPVRRKRRARSVRRPAAMAPRGRGRRRPTSGADDEERDASPVAPTQSARGASSMPPTSPAAIAIAFISAKALDVAWLKLQNYQPTIGEPRDEIVDTARRRHRRGAATCYWYRTRARQLAEEVAAEISKVTWPSRTEVTNGTVVVIVTTVVSTVYFALLDRFWGFLTNLVYGGT